MHNPLNEQAGRTRAMADRLRQLSAESQPPYNWQEFQRRRSRQRLATSRGRMDWSHAAAAALVVVVIGGLAVWSRVGMMNHNEGEKSGARPWPAAAHGAAGGALPATTGDAGRAAGDPWPSTAEVRHGAGDSWPSIGGGGRPSSDTSTVAGETALTANARGAAGETAPSVGPGSKATADVQAANDAVRAARDALAANSAQAATAQRSRDIETWLASLPQEPVVVNVGTQAAVAGLEDRIAQVDDLLTFGRLDGSQPDRLAVLQQERARLVGSLAQVRYAEFVAAGSLD
jgi:hypothetical protein